MKYTSDDQPSYPVGVICVCTTKMKCKRMLYESVLFREVTIITLFVHQNQMMLQYVIQADTKSKLGHQGREMPHDNYYASTLIIHYQRQKAQKDKDSNGTKCQLFTCSNQMLLVYYGGLVGFYQGVRFVMNPDD
ncbi:unnamed protein product [Lactuca saligna]|uniref:Uncharacterized protein n=1 Tax=Lactuca saligna TaxID=75948 RepID=A0AA35YQS8_LACSI|nr:unnamed protein product [Lactuca saligna]